MASKWRTVRLGKITDWASGGTPPKDDAKYWGGTIPWISASSMYGNRYSDSELKLTEAGLARGSRLAEIGSVLLLVRGSMLHQRVPVGIATRSVAFNQDVKAIKAKEGLSPWFLFYWFLGNERNLLELVDFTGIGAGKFDTKQLQELPVNLPTLAEQELIVAVAKTLDDKIELNRRMNETLEAIARAIFKSWFVDFDPVRAKASGEPPESICRRLRLTPDLLALFPDRLVDSELGEIPVGWEVSTLAEQAHRCGGAIQTGPFGSQLHASDYVEEGVPVVMPQDLVNRRVSTLRIARIGEEDAARLSRHRLLPDDIVYSRRGDVERHAVISKREAGWLCGTGCLLVRLGPAWPSQAFLSLALDRPETREWIVRHAVGATMPNLNTTILGEVPLLLPPDNLIKAFDLSISAFSARRDALESESETLAELRDTLLPKLLAGDVRLPAFSV